MGGLVTMWGILSFSLATLEPFESMHLDFLKHKNTHAYFLLLTYPVSFDTPSPSNTHIQLILDLLQ